MANVLLNIADIQTRSRVNGPGIRTVVWVQGCTLNCPGCFNTHTHPHEPVTLLDPVQLGRDLLDFADCEGITISGGEPFQQAEACALLARTAQDAGRSVMVFSGYTHEYLCAAADPHVRGFLSRIDLLVAGPYVEQLKTDGRGWVASSNQRVVPLSDRYDREAIAGAPDSPVVEFKAGSSGISVTGFPEAQDLRWIREQLRG